MGSTHGERQTGGGGESHRNTRKTQHTESDKKKRPATATGIALHRYVKLTRCVYPGAHKLPRHCFFIYIAVVITRMIKNDGKVGHGKNYLFLPADIKSYLTQYFREWTDLCCWRKPHWSVNETLVDWLKPQATAIKVGHFSTFLHRVASLSLHVYVNKCEFQMH